MPTISVATIIDIPQIDGITSDESIINQYKTRLSDEQIQLLSELMGSLSLNDSANVDRFDYPSV